MTENILSLRIVICTYMSVTMDITNFIVFYLVNVYEGLSPSIVKLDASSGFFSKASYLVKFEKEGYQLKTCQITSKIDGWYFGNILLGGLIGMLIVDPATGAMYKLDTDAVDVSLMPERTVSIIDIQSLPDEMKNHLVLLENN